MEKLTKALMTDETGQAIVAKLTALSGQMHELAMATRGSAILFESESDISVLGDGGYLAVYVGSTNPLVISGWTGDNSLVTGHLYYLVKSGTAVASSDLGEYGGTAVTSTTFNKHGVPADDFAVGEALADKADADDVTELTTVVAGKADTADVEAEINSLDERVTAIESGSADDVPYEERGDLYTLLVSAEVVEMQKTDYRLTYNATTGAVTEQYYTAGHPVTHYIDPSKLGYERLWVHTIVANVWSVLADYDPIEDTYTFLNILSNQNTGKLIDFSTIPEGHYLALTSNTANWKTGLLVYLGRVWIKPGYVSKHDGWDVPASDKPIPCDLYPVSMGYPAIYIDLEKYQDRLVRLVNSGTMASNVSLGLRSYTDLAGTSYVDVSSFFSVGNFSAWIYPGRYLVLFYRGKMTENTLNLTMGYVPVENALACKQRKKWGPKIAFHNVDTRNEMIFACAVGSIFDIDVCRTLDGKFVCIHNTQINGHTIAQTNLADLELTYNQMEVTDALKLMRDYGVINYFNFRETTPAQVLELVERAYNYLGDTIAYDSNITEVGSELANHLDKYYTWQSGSTLDALINLGARKGRIFSNRSALEGTDYNVADIIVCKSVASGKTLSNFEWDGECAVLWINDNIPGFVRG